MRFSIKRAGILVAILAIVVLALAGCLCAVNVGNGGESNLDSIDTNFMTTADKEYLLEGSREDMAKVWSDAMLESAKYNKHIKLTLMNDWEAKDGIYITSMGDGYGFNYGRFEIVKGAEITLDLNGHTIDKKVTGKGLEGDSKPDSSIFAVYGTLNLVDSEYDIAEVNRVYEQYKDQDAEATERVLLQKLSEINCGKITGNDSRHAGAAICVYTAGTLNMYGGMIVGNEATDRGGGIYTEEDESVLNIYNGLIIGNKANIGAGIFTRAQTHINGGIIAENETIGEIRVGSETGCGAGIFISRQNGSIIQDCIISHNRSIYMGGGIYTYWGAAVDFNRVIFSNNYSESHGAAAYLAHYRGKSVNNVNVFNNVSHTGDTFHIQTPQYVLLQNLKINNNKSYGSTTGLNITRVYSESIDCLVEMNNVEIANNEIIASKDLAMNTSSSGFNVLSNSRTTIKMRQIRIVNNKANKEIPAFLNQDFANILLGEYVEISNNIGNDKAFDVYLQRDQKFQIAGNLDSGTGRSRIGLNFATNYGDTPFTINYLRQCSGKDANAHFYLTHSDKLLEFSNGEVKVGTATKPTIKDIQWKYKINDNVDTWHNVQGSLATLEYNKNGYLISNSANEVMKIGSTDKLTQDLVTDKGKYSYTLTNATEYAYPVFTLNINPKKVDLVWSNTALTYNGNSQIPTAKVVGDDTCSVTRTGAQTNVGNGYSVTATALGNTNYEINPATKSALFSIAPANLTINVTTKSYTKEYNGKVVSLPNDWYTLYATLLGQDKNTLLDLVFDIDRTAFIPQFNGADSATAVGEYTISTKPFNAKEVFTGNGNYNVTIKYNNTGKLTINKPSVVRPTDNSGYDFILNENGRRVNYKDKDWIHGDNDSDISTFILGNIAPNTSIQTFVSNLSFDITNITIYNRAGDVVYGTGAIDYYVNNINNGLEIAVGTGWRIEYTKLTGGEETIYLSVLGDLTGDGKVNSADVNYIRKLISDPTMYASLNDKPYIQLSALIINNGKLTNADGEILWNIVCGKMSITDFI